MFVRGIGWCFLYIDTRVIDSVIEALIVDEVTQLLNIFDADVIGKQTVVADAMKASWQHVYEEAPYELAGCQGQGFVSITPFAAIVLPLEGDTAFVAGDEAAVADGNPMGVAGQVGEYGFGPGKRTLGIDDPVDVAQWR